MQNFFSNLFKLKDDCPIGLVSLGIQKNKLSSSKKDALAYTFDKTALPAKIYDDKKILTLHDFID